MENSRIGDCVRDRAETCKGRLRTLRSNEQLMNAKAFWFASFLWLLLVANASAFYDPGLQRWINRDPIAEEGGINLAEFASSEPASGVDALGLNDCPRWAEYMCEHPPSENTRKTMAVGCAIAVPVGAGLWLLPPAGAAATTVGAAKAASTASKAANTAAKAENLATKATKAEKQIQRVREQENALDKLKDIERAQQKVRKGQYKGKAIDEIGKSRQNAKKLLRDIENDPSCADDL